jgi:hypothetical protein
MHFLSENRHVFCHRCIRKIINSLPLRRKIASQFSSSTYVRIIAALFAVIEMILELPRSEHPHGKTQLLRLRIAEFAD